MKMGVKENMKKIFLLLKQGTDILGNKEKNSSFKVIRYGIAKNISKKVQGIHILAGKKNIGNC